MEKLLVGVLLIVLSLGARAGYAETTVVQCNVRVDGGGVMTQTYWLQNGEKRNMYENENVRLDLELATSGAFSVTGSVRVGDQWQVVEGHSVGTVDALADYELTGHVSKPGGNTGSAACWKGSK